MLSMNWRIRVFGILGQEDRTGWNETNLLDHPVLPPPICSIYVRGIVKEDTVVPSKRDPDHP